MKGRGWTFTGWALAISCALGAVMIGVIFYLDSVAESRRLSFEQAQKDYDTVKKLRLRYRQLEARKAKMPIAGGQDEQSWLAFLDSKARETQLPDARVQEEPPSRGPLKEKSFTVLIDTKQGATFPRQNFVQFLDKVETQRPSFKSKYIMMKFSQGDLSRATATFSHFER
jgi:hypothetical protein